MPKLEGMHDQTKRMHTKLEVMHAQTKKDACLN